MTSKNLFWASCKENNKRRIGVWIIAVLAQLMMYAGVVTVYLSRIRTWNSNGAYRTYEDFKNAMYQAAKDALGFQDNLLPVVTLLAFIIGMQGFSYLYDRRKVDMYHSVPVPKNRRFAVVYVNGVAIYLAATAVGLAAGVITAAVQGAVNGSALAVTCFAFLWNLLYFLVIYHTVILAVMLTGSRFITVCIAGALLLYETAVYGEIEDLQYAFFSTVSTFYVSHAPKLSAVYDYYAHVWELKQTPEVRDIARAVLPYYGKWFILSVVILAAAWWCYGRRPSEAAGKAVAFPRIEPALKVAVVVPVAVGIGMWVHNSASSDAVLAAAGMVISGVIACAVMEIVYDFDIKSMFRHLLSSGIAVALILVIFLIYETDMFGYDAYIPQADELDSIALTLDIYETFWSTDYGYISPAEFSREHMRLVDTEPVLALADKARRNNLNNWETDVPAMDDARMVQVMYRLKSGREVGRRFWVDYDDPDNEELLNQIVGTKEYKEGTYQIMTDRASYDLATGLTYTNGATNVALPTAETQALRAAYIKDMERFDFTMASTEYPCGQVTIRFPNYMSHRIDVYESFENTVAFLKAHEAYDPIQLNPEDIADMMITNFHYEMAKQADYESEAVYNLARGAVNTQAVWAGDYDQDYTVSEVFSDPEQFAQIVPVIYPAYVMSSAWHNNNELDENYEVYITFKKDTTYPYDRGSYGFYYRFYAGQVPEFVEEATAWSPELAE